MILQSRIDPGALVHLIESLLEDSPRRRDLLAALEKWDFPDAPRLIASRIATAVGKPLTLPAATLDFLPA